MQTIARFAVQRRWWVIAGWVAFMIAAQVLLSSLGGSNYKDDFKLPHTETQTVSQLLAGAGLNSQNGASGTMVLHAKSGTVNDFSSTVKPALDKLCTSVKGIATVDSPYGTVSCSPVAPGRSGAAGSGAAAGLVSADKTIGIVNINWASAQPSVSDITAVHDQLKGLNNPKLQVEFTGNAFAALSQSGGGGVPPEVLGMIAALVILAIVFRTFGATVLPLISAVAAMGSGLALIGLLSHVMSVASFADQLALLMILGVGVDYALFIITRHRRNLLRGMSVNESILLAINTSGRAVMFAGTTVCIALLGLWALGVSFLYGVSLGTAIGVALTMVASLSLLPALLSLLGMRILPRSKRAALKSDRLVKILLCVIPPVCVIFWALYLLELVLRPVLNGMHARSDRRAVTDGFWYRWSHFIERRRIVLGIAAGIVLVVLAIPFFSMRLGSSDQGNDPSGSTTRKGYDLIAQGFGPGYNSSLQLVVDGPGATDQAYLGKLVSALKTESGVAPDSVHAIPAAKNIALVTFKSTTSPQDSKTTDLVKNLRSDVLPPLYSGTSNHVYVYGVTAIFVDFAKVLSAKMVYFFVAVIGLSFLLLLVAFRSLVIPVTAAVMNLLAAGASFGIVVAIFQWGWLSNLLGIGGAGPIEPFIPVMFFAILFGLSMDYQVFLVSRMHEEWLHTKDNRRSITVGQGETGGIITAAAIIMIAVFGGFVLGDARVIKLFGIGLASAVFLDAFIVRTVLVPSLMHVIGKANWYYPAWLDRITPRISIEAADEAEDEASPDGGEQDERELVNV
ncbi:MAG TPA: MMPL family transporter [Jatrophihabitans sp.]|jgi:RND superfamily putative drug exporter